MMSMVRSFILLQKMLHKTFSRSIATRTRYGVAYRPDQSSSSKNGSNRTVDESVRPQASGTDRCEFSITSIWFALQRQPIPAWRADSQSLSVQRLHAPPILDGLSGR